MRCQLLARQFHLSLCAASTLGSHRLATQRTARGTAQRTARGPARGTARGTEDSSTSTHRPRFWISIESLKEPSRTLQRLSCWGNKATRCRQVIVTSAAWSILCAAARQAELPALHLLLQLLRLLRLFVRFGLCVFFVNRPSAKFGRSRGREPPGH